ncbi:angiopoietin-4-like [Pollicipes pollicipes]|uniref:angiopoietin-4-like n=1 Tax=Pollicipes pollicipes TaxID=41117 RepID=UPI0018859E09|nr:angiopoietin-4-like [Pollicipes pollicipes]
MSGRRQLTLAALLVTWSAAQVGAQVFVSEPRYPGASVPEQVGGREEPEPTPPLGRDAEQTLLTRLAKLELLDAKLSKIDVLEKVFHFVQLDANVARISEQVDRISERLNEPRAPVNCAPSSDDVREGLTSLGERLGLLERSVQAVSNSMNSQLDRLHSQLDALLERNVQLNTRAETMREDVGQLLRASEIVDDQLEQTDNNLKYLRDELDLVKQKAHTIHHQQHKSEAAIKETTVTVHEKIDGQVSRLGEALQHRFNLITIDLTMIVDTILRAQNQSQVPSPPLDYWDDDFHPLEDADFRAKFVNEIRVKIAEDSKKMLGSACAGTTVQKSSEALETSIVKTIKSAINSSLEMAASEQWRPTDCSDVYRQSTRSGLFTIYPNACSRGHQMQVFCDMETTGGGWTVVQRRGQFADRSSLDFYQDWATYKWGFGNISEEFYLGNELIHLLTASNDFVLRVELEDFSGDRRYAEYQHFSIDREDNQYRLNVGKYSGNAGDAMTYHNGFGFTTKDREHDSWPGKNCATHYRGGWWFASCHRANLNGVYLSGHHSSYGNGIIWYPWRGYYYSLRSSRMMVRPRRTHENSPTNKR